MTETQARWKNRRRMAWGTFVICFGYLGWALAVGGDSGVVKAVIGAINMILPSVVIGYIGFATWDEKK